MSPACGRTLVRDVRIPRPVWHAFNTPTGLGRSNELRAFVTIATAYVRSCDRLDPPAVANILYGTHGLGNCREARQLLAVVAPKIAACGDPFTVQQYSSVREGMPTDLKVLQERLVLKHVQRIEYVEPFPPAPPAGGVGTHTSAA